MLRKEIKRRRTIDTPNNKDRICYHCGFNNGKKQDDNSQQKQKVGDKSEKIIKPIGNQRDSPTLVNIRAKDSADTHIKEKLSPEFDDLIKTLQFPDKFYNTLDRVVKREVQESREQINKVIEEWFLEHRKKGDGIGKLYEELKLRLDKEFKEKKGVKDGKK